MTTIAILGANGRLSKTVAKAFLKDGYQVTAITRSGKPIDELVGAKFMAADAANLPELIHATQGSDIIFNGLNPLYTEWELKVLPMAKNVLEACKVNKAIHLYPGNVYNYGSPMPLELHENTPMRPSTPKGRIRVEVEAMFENAAHQVGGVQTILLRAGDFFGDTGTGSWFDLASVSKFAKGVFTAAGPENIIHEWAYLPDFALGFVKLANMRNRLQQFENLNFPSHAITELQLKAAIEMARGKPLKLARVPWFAIKIMGLFQPMMKSISQMSYLRFEPHRLVSTRLESLIGPIPHTPLEAAVRQALIDQRLLKDEVNLAA